MAREADFVVAAKTQQSHGCREVAPEVARAPSGAWESVLVQQLIQLLDFERYLVGPAPNLLGAHLFGGR